jgi:hypothetical protein
MFNELEYSFENGANVKYILYYTLTTLTSEIGCLTRHRLNVEFNKFTEALDEYNKIVKLQGISGVKIYRQITQDFTDQFVEIQRELNYEK